MCVCPVSGPGTVHTLNGSVLEQVAWVCFKRKTAVQPGQIRQTNSLFRGQSAGTQTDATDKIESRVIANLTKPSSASRTAPDEMRRKSAYLGKLLGAGIPVRARLEDHDQFAYGMTVKTDHPKWGTMVVVLSAETHNSMQIEMPGNLTPYTARWARLSKISEENLRQLNPMWLAKSACGFANWAKRKNPGRGVNNQGRVEAYIERPGHRHEWVALEQLQKEYAGDPASFPAIASIPPPNMSTAVNQRTLSEYTNLLLVRA